MRLVAKRMVALGACLALFLFLGQALGAKRIQRPQAVGISYLPELEKNIYRLTNEARRKHGLSTLSWERSLCTVARSHSADMLHRGYFSHVDPDGKSPKDRIVSGYPHPMSLLGENIWSGSGRDLGDTRHLARVIVDNWVASPGHRKNLLNPEYTDIGVGVVYRGQDVRTTQVFVRTPK